MPGSPRKRARRQAEEREKNMAAGIAESSPGQGPEPESPAPPILQAGQPTRTSGEPTGGDDPQGAPPANLPAPAVTLKGEVLPPEGAPEPTRTALKRAMRQKAQEHADKAIAVLVANMTNENLAADKRAAAANSILEWGFGKPGMELGDVDGGLLVMIQKFGAKDE